MRGSTLRTTILNAALLAFASGAVVAGLASCATGTVDDTVDAAVVNPGDPDAAVVNPGDPDAAVVNPGDPDAAVVNPGDPDAAVEPPPPPDAAVPAPAPDSCAAALDITTAAAAVGGTIIEGDSTGYANDVYPGEACTGFDLEGPDAIYVVNVPSGTSISATVRPDGWDPAIYIVKACTLEATCVAGADDGLEGDPDSVRFTTTSAGPHFIVIDGFDTDTAGRFTLEVTAR